MQIRSRELVSLRNYMNDNGAKSVVLSVVPAYTDGEPCRCKQPSNETVITCFKRLSS